MSTAYHLKNKSVTKLPTCSRSYRYLFFFVWKLIRLQIIFTKTAGIEIDLTVAPVCQKYWYKRFFFWKLYILFYTLLSTWRRSGYIKVDINLIYISILKALSLFSRFVLSHFWKNICLDKTKYAKLYCKQKLKNPLYYTCRNVIY